MKRLPLFFITLLLHQLTLGQQRGARDSSVLRIDPESAVGGTDGKVYGAITFIPLDNGSQSVVGEVSKLEVVEKYLIVFDRGVDQIVIFNKDGSFHAKCANIPGIQKNGKLAGNFNFNMFGDFAVRRDKNQIVVKTNLDQGSLFTFNYDGMFTGKIALPSDDAVKAMWGFQFLGGDTWVYNVQAWGSPKDSSRRVGYQLYLSKGFSSAIKGEISYNPRTIAQGPDVQITMDGPFYGSRKNSDYFFTRSYDYNIYAVDKKGVGTAYRLLFPAEYSIPEDFLANEEKYRSKRPKYLTDNRQKIYAISNVYLVRDNLLFKINNNKFGDNNKIFSYNLKTGALLSLLRVSPDGVSSFLPVMNLNNGIKACDGDDVYTSLSSLEMFKAYEATQEKHPDYPAALKAYFSTQTRKSNPVIVRLQLKSDL